MRQQCIIRETEEETGYGLLKFKSNKPMSPGVLTEILYLLLVYNESMKVNEGGGLEAEQENIEVLEMKYEEAYNKEWRKKDAKTILLLQYAKINLGF
jgi:8-oxo-dGTP pyrophosphatase MutT (NUDIX family)